VGRGARATIKRWIQRFIFRKRGAADCARSIALSRLFHRRGIPTSTLCPTEGHSVRIGDLPWQFPACKGVSCSMGRAVFCSHAVVSALLRATLRPSRGLHAFLNGIGDHAAARYDRLMWAVSPYAIPVAGLGFGSACSLAEFFAPEPAGPARDSN
jgi:hypothetical protein